jgi:DNA-binding MarR family transcriptional regulator
MPTGKSSKKRPVMPVDGESLGLQDLLGYNLRRAHGVQRARFRYVFAPHRIRPVQLSILGLLYEKSALKQSELGKAIDVKPANIVTLLDELERRNLIVRRPASTDRRSYAVQLTPAGRKVTRELLRLHRSLEDNLADYLGRDERKELLRLLRKVRRANTSPVIEEP